MAVLIQNVKDHLPKSAYGFILMALFTLIWETKTAHAQLQELDINPISVDGAIPVFRSHPDMAAIIIRSSLTNLTFSSNLQIIEERSDPAAGEYILIIEPVTQTIRIDTPGFLAGRIPVRGLSARQVVYYSIEPAAREADGNIPVVIRVQPTQAQVSVNGDVVDINRSVLLSEGTHHVFAEIEGFRNLERTIEVNDEHNFFELIMEETSPEPVRIQTNPPGATVFLEGVDFGQTDRNGLLEFYRFPGQYTVSVSHSGFISQSRNVEILENTVNEMQFNLTRNAGMLSLNITPQDAYVLLNRESYDPSETIYVLPGTYRLEVMRDGYESHSENIIVERDQLIEKQIELTMLFGGLYYSSSPASASAILRDNSGRIVEMWSGLRRFESLPVDDYVLTVSDQGFRTHQENIRIESNRVIERRIVLSDAESTVATTTSTAPCPDFVTDNEGNEYRVILIGKQCWMGENLRSTYYQNDDLLSTAATSQEWQNTEIGKFGIYNNEMELVEDFGKIYNWFAVSDTRNLCPLGWRVPSDEDWTILEKFLGLSDTEISNFGLRGDTDNVGGKLKISNSSQWSAPNEGASNEYLWSANPGGLRLASGQFANMGNFGYWWSSTEFSENTAIWRSLSS